MLLLLVLACGAPCAPDDDCARCVARDRRDACLYERLQTVPAAQLDLAIQTADAINDPVVRGAGVSLWLERSAPALSRPEQESMCSLLEGSVRRACDRRAASPHLQR